MENTEGYVMPKNAIVAGMPRSGTSTHSSYTAGWLNISDIDEVFYWLHQPSTPKISSLGVVIVGPFGPEYMHCHRSVKWLAIRLADAGIQTIRFDHVGMGNSSGELHQANIFDRWVNTPVSFKNFMLDKLQVKEVVFVGIRSGALILSNILKNERVSAAVYWYPYTRGKVYLRDLQLIDKMLKNESHSEDLIEGGGYPLAVDCQHSLNSLNTMENNININQLLLIESSKLLANKKLAGYLADQCNLQQLSLAGLTDMIKQASESIVPTDNLDEICNWICSLEQGPYLNQEKIDCATDGFECETFSEKTLCLSEGSIFGVLCEPRNEYQKILLLVNAGSSHHVGPNRMNVDLARLAAKNNIASYRFDLNHLGDSKTLSCLSSNNPYQKSSIDDILKVIDFFTANYQQKIILAGLCSGAHNFFHAALASNSVTIEQLVIINPLTFYWKEGQSITEPEDNQGIIKEKYYNEQVFSIKKWLKLLISPKKILSVMKYLTSKFRGKLRSGFSKIGIVVKSQLETDLRRLKNRNINISFLYSDGDPGYKILLNQAPIFVIKNRTTTALTIKEIKNADHTFSSIQSRADLNDALLRVIAVSHSD